MRQLFLGGVVVLLLFVLSTFLFIPSRIVVTKIVMQKSNVNAAGRVIEDSSGWGRWWPGAANGRLRCGGMSFVFSERLLRSAAIEIRDKGDAVSSLLVVYPLDKIDSSYLQWQLTLDAGWNPIERITKYWQGKRIKECMASVLAGLRDFVENQKNIYGIPITESGEKDSVVTKEDKFLATYPTDSVIYGEVRRLENFITAHGGVRTGYPMVNASSVEGGRYQLRVALPTNIFIRLQGQIYSRTMVKGKYLITEVHGGPWRVNAVLERMNEYISDYGRTVMAIPFYSLVTDRIAEPDSTKWVTKIYYPIY